MQQKLAGIHGIGLRLGDEALEVIAQQAEQLGTGARGLHRLIGQALDPVDHRWGELADARVTEVVVTAKSMRE